MDLDAHRAPRRRGPAARRARPASRRPAACAGCRRPARWRRRDRGRRGPDAPSAAASTVGPTAGVHLGQDSDGQGAGSTSCAEASGLSRALLRQVVASILARPSGCTVRRARQPLARRHDRPVQGAARRPRQVRSRPVRLVHLQQPALDGRPRRRLHARRGRSSAGRFQPRARSSRSILSAYVDSPSCGTGAGSPPQGLDEQVGPDSDEAALQVLGQVGGTDLEPAPAVDRAGCPSPPRLPSDRRPSPGHRPGGHVRRAPRSPARQQREVEVDHRQRGRARAAGSGGRRRRRRRDRRRSRAPLTSLVTGKPSSERSLLHRAGRGLAPLAPPLVGA